MKKSIGCMDENGDISAMQLRQFLEKNLDDRDSVLNSPYANMRFQNNSEIASKIVEDTNLSAMELINHILEIEDFSADGLDSMSKLINTLGTSVLHVRNVSVLNSTEKLDNNEFAYVDLNSFIKEFCDYLDSVLPVNMFRNIHIVNGTRKELMCAAEPGCLTLILVNLVHNALIHGHSDDRRIDIVLNRIRKSNRVAVSVVDRGVGLDTDKMYRIMENGLVKYGNGFGRLRSYGGCGLLVSQKMAKMMCGNIMFGNVDGGGASFTVLLNTPDGIEKHGIRLRDSGENVHPYKPLISLVFSSLRTDRYFL